MIIRLHKIPSTRIMGALRKEFSMSPLAKSVRASALSSSVGEKGGKRRDCACCGEAVPEKDCHVDHISPVIPITRETSDMTWDEIINRMFCVEIDPVTKEEYCDVSKLQLLCTGCHSKKTKEENMERTNNKRIVGAKKKLPTSVTDSQISELIAAIPDDIKLSGEAIGAVASVVVKWYKKNFEKKV